jgi:hypothetical protein
MAEIRIQEKKRPIWPWILLILIIIAAAVLIYMYLNRNDMNNEYEGAPADTTGYYRSDTLGQGDSMMDAPGDEVEQFNAFTTGDTAGVFSKEYVMNGFALLSGAVYNLVHNDTTTREQNPQADSLMTYTQNLTDTTSKTFSREVNRSMRTAYNVIMNMQKRNFPDLNDEIGQLQKTVGSFDASRPVEAQEQPVRNFFRMTGSILSNMKNTARAI